MPPDPQHHRSHDRGVTVLLIEDDADIRTIVALALRLDPGIRLVEADQGGTALDYLRASPIPDLILIDNSLPDMDGVELTTLIHRRHPVTSKRIAFFTASVRLEETRRFEATGAIGVIEKPFDPLTLSSTIRSLIS